MMRDSIRTASAGTWILRLGAVFFLTVLLVYPQTVFEGAREGLLLWFNTVFPAQFPFFVCISLLIELDVLPIFQRIFEPFMRRVFGLPGEASFVWLSGCISGYPVGAKAAMELWNKGELTKGQFQHLLCFCNNSGPLFILGTIGVGLLQNVTVGYVLLAAHILSSLVNGILFRFVYEKGDAGRREGKRRPISPLEKPFGKMLGDSVYSGMELILQIGGFIILFSVLLRLLEGWQVAAYPAALIHRLLPVLPVDVVESMLYGILELTNGVRYVSRTSAALPVMAAACGFLTAFGGLSIQAQTAAVLKEGPVSFGAYLGAKVVQGVIAGGLSMLLALLFLR
ncbi:nucleoside recognition domain-containing protein [Bianquea renquensis]|uniref:Nucleoside transporter/FeoB GTPase Gate domain-containing protein n=1 Tax=Bianquea renquensis TaxID=2763661 RepID=A0A926I1T7_9FIRM|nr:nucleoside recognition domain-containing protein [Bianquea renquensis]MBC8543768.1 hypothetical protein [Bianquea renquensis]